MCFGALKSKYEVTIKHAMYKGKFEGKNNNNKALGDQSSMKQEPIKAKRKQHEAPTTNTKAIMVIKEADLFFLRNVEYVL